MQWENGTCDSFPYIKKLIYMTFAIYEDSLVIYTPL